MSVKSVIGSLSSFLAHHVADLSAIETAVATIANAVPVNSGTRDAINEALATIKQSVAGISAFLDAVESGDVVDGVPTVQISESDLENAVSARLSALLPDAVASYVAAHPPVVDGDALDAAVAAYMAAHPIAQDDAGATDTAAADANKSKSGK